MGNVRETNHIFMFFSFSSLRLCASVFNFFTPSFWGRGLRVRGCEEWSLTVQYYAIMAAPNEAT